MEEVLVSSSQLTRCHVRRKQVTTNRRLQIRAWLEDDGLRRSHLYHVRCVMILYLAVSKKSHPQGGCLVGRARGIPSKGPLGPLASPVGARHMAFRRYDA